MRRKGKRIIGCLLAVAMTVGAMPIAMLPGSSTEIFAEETNIGVYGDYQYQILKNGTIEIKKYTGSDASVVVPDMIDGKVVSTIGWSAFYSVSTLTEVSLPESLVEIKSNAFHSCSSLKEITIPDSVTKLGGCVFDGCTSLKEITIPEKVEEITWDMFGQCSSLQQINVAEENSNYSSVDGVVFNKTKTELVAFPCGKSGEYQIPQGTQIIGEGAFSDSGLNKISIPDGVTTIEADAFYFCKKLNEISIPDTVTTIGDSAFAYCDSIREINIPKGVTEIKYNPFQGCQKLCQINVSEENDNYSSIDGVLFNKEQTILLSFPGERWGEYEIPDGTLEIGQEAFYECWRMNKITIPDGVTTIGVWAFFGCDSLVEINLPNEVTQIGIGAFFGCDSLVEINLPKGITKIEDNLFIYCSSLQKIKIPVGVTEIGIAAFNNCNSLTEVNIPEGVTKIDSAAFLGCTNLRKISIPSEVVYIAADAFDGITDLNIIGYKDSYAETYANEHNISFISLQKLSSDDNIEIYYEPNQFEGDITFHSSILNETDENYQSAIRFIKPVESGFDLKDIAFEIYDITILNESQNIVQPQENITVKIPCPDGYEGAKCRVYYVSENGKLTDMQAVYVNGYLAFETTHFSTYLVTETELEETLLYGDVNADGEISLMDSALIRRYLAGWNVTIDETAADVNGDGDVSLMDSALIRRYLAGWNVALRTN